MPDARHARAADLEGMLALFAVSEVSASVEPYERARKIWIETMERPGLSTFVSDEAGVIVASCMLITAPNLLRSGRQHGFLENVVTHPAWRGRGHGQAVVGAALRHAWAIDCHHVLMQSGRTDPRTHVFYEKLGFRPGLRTAYVAMRSSPDTPLS